MFIGYARVSTLEQNFDLQFDALRQASCERVFQDMAGGSSTARKGLLDAVEYARDGDTIVVWRLDRLGRSLSQLIDFTALLRKRNIEFRSLVDAIDTTTTMGQFFFHITASFAELERNLIRERTLAGLEAARIRGRRGGRSKALDNDDLAMAFELYQSRKVSVDQMSKKFGVTKRTLFRYFERIKSA